MLNFAANLTMLFNEDDFLKRFKAASDIGFQGVEYLFPYDFDKNDIALELKTHGLVQVLHNLPAGNWDRGERGIACYPDRVSEFREGVDLAIEYANALNCQQLNCLAGIPSADHTPEDISDTLISNLRYAADELKNEGIRLLIEPINVRDMPGFYLNYTNQAREIIESVGSDNLFLQYDIYHMQIMEGDLTKTIESNLDIIKHLQIADNPGRNEPGTGEINYPFLFSMLEDFGYQGWVGCEYIPKNNTISGLQWIKQFLG